MSHPKFLAVACFEGKLSTTEAWQIAEEAERFISLSIGSPRFGEIAIDLGLLTPETVEWILGKQTKYISENKSLNDPLKQTHRKKLHKAFSVRKGAIGGSVMLLLLILTWHLSSHDWGQVALVASVLGTIWLALTNIVPAIFEGSFPTHRLFPWLIMIIGPLSWGYCIYVAYDWLELSRNLGLGATNHWYRLLLSTILLGAAYAAFYIISMWRHSEIWFLESRIDLMRGLVTRTFTAIARLRSTNEIPEYQVLISYANQVLHEVARILVMNPWENVIKKYGPRRGPIGIVSVWYLEPDRNEVKDFSRFKVLLTVAPTAPADVIAAFDKIRKNHHPTRWDANRYRQAKALLTKEDVFDEKAFLSLPERKDFVSVIGYAFEHKQGIHSGDANRHLYFDHSYTESFYVKGLSSTVRRWLDFRSFAAYPVLTPESTDEPIGVLIAFKNLRNGFTPEDKTALVTASRLLGLLLSEGGKRR